MFNVHFIHLTMDKPLYPFPYKGKPRFITECLLRDDSTTSTNIQVITRNSELAGFHRNPFPVPQTPSSDCTPSPLTSPSSLTDSDSDTTDDSIMPSTELEIAMQKVLKQCHYLISYLCYEALHQSATMKKNRFIERMGESYLGDTGRPHLIPHAYLFVTGK